GGLGGRELDTLFIGGGTPSLMGGPGLVALSEALSQWFSLDPEGTEWTVEANPASFDRSLAEAWRAAGVNRVSLGVQALDDGALKWLGRLHDGRVAREAVATAAEAGFEDINIDLLFGLPEEVERDLEAEVAEALALPVTHVSLYGLTIEPRTALARSVRQGRTRPPGGERYASEYRAACSALREAGFEHYEVSNFARPGHQCRHNWSYWKRIPYLGLGPSGHGFLPPYRTWNVFRWDRYERALRTGAGPLEGWERPDPGQRALERIWLGLRTNEGVPARWESPAARRSLDRWEAAGWMETRADRLVGTVEGWLRLDAMVAEIAEEEERWRFRR
ncbi:MAG: coproporphyrinogen-III oxidase family protein, partial [Gemmatimonadota bacterium]|nr:coproporphyrinogen-III oxidase family protein [Gemmatimonadota bacterium]